MRIDQAFERCGFEIMDVKRPQPDQLFIDVRVPLGNPRIPARWVMMFEQVVREAETAKNWKAVVLKRFYARDQVLRYRWRIEVEGDLAVASNVIARAALNSLRAGNELDVVPVRSSGMLPPDPAAGRYRGAYSRDDNDRASQVVASAFLPGAG